MSGHSKWHSIKHQKGAADAARGKLFARLARQIEVAARAGGGDADSNPTLRTMIQKARDGSMVHQLAGKPAAEVFAEVRARKNKF